MTVSNPVTFQAYVGDGVVDDFPIPFDYQDHLTEILVFLRNNTTGAITPQTVSVHYTLTGMDLAHPDTVTFDPLYIPPTGETIFVMRTLAITQPGDYINNGAFLAEDHESLLDQIVLRLQEVARETDRAVKFPYNAAFAPEIPHPVIAGAMVRVNATGTAMELADTASFTGPPGPTGNGLLTSGSQDLLAGEQLIDIVFDADIGTNQYVVTFQFYNDSDLVQNQQFFIAKILTIGSDKFVIYLNEQVLGNNNKIHYQVSAIF